MVKVTTVLGTAFVPRVSDVLLNYDGHGGVTHGGAPPATGAALVAGINLPDGVAVKKFRATILPARDDRTEATAVLHRIRRNDGQAVGYGHAVGDGVPPVLGRPDGEMAFVGSGFSSSRSRSKDLEFVVNNRDYWYVVNVNLPNSYTLQEVACYYED